MNQNKFCYFSRAEKKDIIIYAKNKAEVRAKLAEMGYPDAPMRDIFNLTKMKM